MEDGDLDGGDDVEDALYATITVLPPISLPPSNKPPSPEMSH